MKYLQDEKAGSLKLADFAALTSNEIAEQIRSKIKGSYIYNLARATNSQTVKCNIILENKRVVRNECALEYRPSEKQLRLIILSHPFLDWGLGGPCWGSRRYQGHVMLGMMPITPGTPRCTSSWRRCRPWASQTKTRCSSPSSPCGYALVGSLCSG